MSRGFNCVLCRKDFDLPEDPNDNGELAVSVRVGSIVYDGCRQCEGSDFLKHPVDQAKAFLDKVRPLVNVW